MMYKSVLQNRCREFCVVGLFVARNKNVGIYPYMSNFCDAATGKASKQKRDIYFVNRSKVVAGRLTRR
jgi:hypothetical protein